MTTIGVQTSLKPHSNLVMTHYQCLLLPFDPHSSLHYLIHTILAFLKYDLPFLLVSHLFTYSNLKTELLLDISQRRPINFCAQLISLACINRTSYLVIVVVTDLEISRGQVRRLQPLLRVSSFSKFNDAVLLSHSQLL